MCVGFDDGSHPLQMHFFSLINMAVLIITC
jgi:hypothetical protein